MSKKYLTVHDMVEIAMLVACAIILNLPSFTVRTPYHVDGGSISFTLIPLLILAFRQGPIKGFIGGGIVYGIIACLYDGWGLYTFPFDYMLASGSVAFAGLFSKSFSLSFAKHSKKVIASIFIGVLLSGIGNLSAHTIGGVIFYDCSWAYSIGYNAGYCIPNTVIAFAALIALLPVLDIINQRYPVRKMSKSVEKESIE